MAKPSISVPDELLAKFDDMLWEAKRDGALDRDVDRSEVIRDLMRLWMQANGAEVQPQNPDIVRSIVESNGMGGIGGGLGGAGSGLDDSDGGFL